MRFCPFCHEEVLTDAVRCQSCGQDLPVRSKICNMCNFTFQDTFFVGSNEYCEPCLRKLIKSVITSTTNTIENASILEYIGVESAEIVIGTGIWSELTSSFQDIFGSRSTEFEKKLNKAKLTNIDKLKLTALQKGANAVIGMDLSYTEFSSNRIAIIASGTLVKITNK